MSCEESQVEILQTAGNKTAQTFTDEVNTKGVTKLYIIRDAREITPTTTVTQSTVAGTVNNGANAVDKDASTNSTLSVPTSIAPAIQRFDFGSIATRSLGILHSSTTGTIGTLSYRIGDTTGSGSWVDIYVSQGPVSKTLFTLAATSFRFVDIRLAVTVSITKTANIFEVFDLVEGWGEINFSMEIQDTARSSWISLPDQPSISTLKTYEGDTQTTDTVNVTLPHKATGLLRFVQVINGKANYSCAVIKVDPCKV